MPHIALFSLALGVLFYPLPKLWIPVCAFLLNFYVPMFLPFLGDKSWLLLHGLTPGLLFQTFLLNAVSAALIGAISLVAAQNFFRRLRPFTADILATFTVAGVFLVVSMIQVAVANYYAQSLSPALQLELGFDEHFTLLASFRQWRGVVVVSAFLLTALQFPKREDTPRIAVIVAGFALMAILHRYGIAGYPMLDAAIVCILLALTLPLSYVPISIVIGSTVYASITGNYLRDIAPATQADVYLETYSIVALGFVILVLALRSYNEVILHYQADSIRRLNQVRDFAGVGILTINLASGKVLLDDVGSRIAGLKNEATLGSLYRKLDRAERLSLRERLLEAPGQPQSVLLRFNVDAEGGTSEAGAYDCPEARGHDLGTSTLSVRKPTRAIVLRIYLWLEQSPTREWLAYGLLVDVTTEHQQEAALRHMLNELNLRQEKQAQLFSIVSHEIRTPASVIAMLIEDLGDTNSLPTVRRQMREASDQLLRVLTDMRQAVNPEKNLEVTVESYVPAELAESLRNLFEGQAAGRGIQIRLALGAGAERARLGDSRRIKQIVGNLLRNAIIHSGGTQITIGFTRVTGPGALGARSCWQVTDNGQGIPPEEVARLFEPFERGTREDPRSKVDGSGLGLYIVKSSVELLGGQVFYFTAPGGGAGYEVRLPEEDADLPVPELSVPAPGAAETAYPAVLRGMSVLLAEDNELVAEITQARLRRVFGRVDCVANGRLALDELLREPRDVLITDLFMPEMEGDVLVRHLREAGVTIPVYGLTAAVVGDDMHRFEVAGASKVMAKPLQIDQMLEHLMGEIARLSGAA
ncbi:ATP-binding protein [Phaeovulum sp. W22_SRMD_FR3]